MSPRPLEVGDISYFPYPVGNFPQRLVRIGTITHDDDGPLIYVACLAGCCHLSCRPAQLGDPLPFKLYLSV